MEFIVLKSMKDLAAVPLLYGDNKMQFIDFIRMLSQYNDIVKFSKNFTLLEL